jgi:transcriptional regulator with XRE-family HTH domain
MEEIGTNLRIERLKKKMKQVELAKVTGIHRSRLSMIEHTWVEPKPEEVERIKAAIDAKGR